MPEMWDQPIYTLYNFHKPNKIIRLEVLAALLYFYYYCYYPIIIHSCSYLLPHDNFLKCFIVSSNYIHDYPSQGKNL